MCVQDGKLVEILTCRTVSTLLTSTLLSCTVWPALQHIIPCDSLHVWIKLASNSLAAALLKINSGLSKWFLDKCFIMLPDNNSQYHKWLMEQLRRYPLVYGLLFISFQAVIMADTILFFGARSDLIGRRGWSWRGHTLTTKMPTKQPAVTITQNSLGLNYA